MPGEGPVAADTTDGEDDTDSLWVETLDIDEDGSMNETQLMWDHEDNILYAYAFATFLSASTSRSCGSFLERTTALWLP